MKGGPTTEIQEMDQRPKVFVNHVAGVFMVKQRRSHIVYTGQVLKKIQLETVLNEMECISIAYLCHEKEKYVGEREEPEVEVQQHKLGGKQQQCWK